MLLTLNCQIIYTTKTHCFNNHFSIMCTKKGHRVLFSGSPEGAALGMEKDIKSFATYINNKVCPYSGIHNQNLDRKQILWGFFVVRSVIFLTVV